MIPINPRSKTVTAIVRRLVRQKKIPKNWPKPSTIDLCVKPAKLGRSRHRSPLEFGIALHEALEASHHGKWIPYEYWRYADALKKWFDALEPTKIYSEWEVGDDLLAGRMDYFVTGGKLNRRGVVELKSIYTEVPTEPRSEDVLQVALYPIADEGNFASYFAALIYVNAAAGKMRVFTWRVMTEMCELAKNAA